MTFGMSLVLSCVALEQKCSSLIDKCKKYIFFFPRAKSYLFSELFLSSLRERAVHSTRVFTLLSELRFICRVVNIFKDDIPWKPPIPNFLAPVSDYRNLEPGEMEVGKNYWDFHCLLSKFSKVLIHVFVKSKGDNHLCFFFCLLLYNQALSHFLFKYFFLAMKRNKAKRSSKYSSSQNCYLYMHSACFLLLKIVKSNHILYGEQS